MTEVRGITMLFTTDTSDASASEQPEDGLQFASGPGVAVVSAGTSVPSAIRTIGLGDL